MGEISIYGFDICILYILNQKQFNLNAHKCISLNSFSSFALKPRFPEHIAPAASRTRRTITRELHCMPRSVAPCIKRVTLRFGGPSNISPCINYLQPSARAPPKATTILMECVTCIFTRHIFAYGVTIQFLPYQFIPADIRKPIVYHTMFADRCIRFQLHGPMHM